MSCMERNCVPDEHGKKAASPGSPNADVLAKGHGTADAGHADSKLTANGNGAQKLESIEGAVEGAIDKELSDFSHATAMDSSHGPNATNGSGMQSAAFGKAIHDLSRRLDRMEKSLEGLLSREASKGNIDQQTGALHDRMMMRLECLFQSLNDTIQIDVSMAVAKAVGKSVGERTVGLEDVKLKAGPLATDVPAMGLTSDVEKQRKNKLPPNLSAQPGADRKLSGSPGMGPTPSPVLSASLSPSNGTGSPKSMGRRTSSPEMLSSQAQQAGKRQHGERKELVQHFQKMNVAANAGNDKTELQVVQDQLSGLRLKVRKVVESSMFNYVFSFLIFINAGVMCVEVDAEASNAHGDTPDESKAAVLGALEHIFIVAFLIEICARLFVYRLTFFNGEGCRWNIFDFVIVLFSVLDSWILKPANQSIGINMSFVRCIRIFRIVRLGRVIRVLRIFQELRVLVDSIFGSFVALAWTVLFLFIIMGVCAIFITAMLASYQRPGPEGEHIFIFFGSVLRSLFTLFQILTLDSWTAVVRPITDEISWAYAIFFCLYICFTVFAVMNVVTGVFVDQAMNATRKDEDMMIQEQLKIRESYAGSLRRIFEDADCDHNGTITAEEFKQHLEDPKVRALLAALELEIDAAESLFSLLDIDGTGEINIEELIMGCVRARGMAKSMDLISLMYELQRVAGRINAIDIGMATMRDDLNLKFCQLYERHMVLESSYQSYIHALMQPA